MSDPAETLPGNTKATAPGIKAKAPGIPCVGTERANKPGTPRKKTLYIPF